MCNEQERVEKELEELRAYGWGMEDNPNRGEQNFFDNLSSCSLDNSDTRDIIRA